MHFNPYESSSGTGQRYLREDSCSRLAVHLSEEYRGRYHAKTQNVRREFLRRTTSSRRRRPARDADDFPDRLRSREVNPTGTRDEREHDTVQRHWPSDDRCPPMERLTGDFRSG